MPTRAIPRIALQNTPFLAYIYYPIVRLRSNYLHGFKDSLFTVPGAIAFITALGTFPFNFLSEQVRGGDVASLRDMNPKLNVPGNLGAYPRNKSKSRRFKKKQNIKQRRAQGASAPVSKRAVGPAAPIVLEEPKQETIEDPPASQKETKEKRKEGDKQELPVPSQGLSVRGSFSIVGNTNLGTEDMAAIDSDIEKGDEPCVIVAAEDISIEAMGPNDPRAHLPVPQQNITVEPRDSDHDRLSWIACYDDSCPVHLSDKNSTGYFPSRPWVPHGHPNWS